MSVDVSFEVLDHLSYAMAHNGIPVVSDIRLQNRGPSMDGAVVRVEIRDSSGLVSLPWSTRADLTAGQSVVLDEVPVRLDPDAMFQISDEQAARVVVRVEHDGDEVGGQVAQTQLLPGNHWRSLPPGLAFELLSAFVLPNDPAIPRLLSEASQILQTETGSPSLEGYQSGMERADAIAGAVWRATQARGIRYAEPPSSWGSIGQKVRTPTTVLEEGIGTCLDTTVVLAAALEQAGLRPVLWVIEGHAFVGYWRDEIALDAVVYTGGAEVANEVDRGRMRLLETTAVTLREEPVSFEESHRLASSHLRDLSKVLAVVDVWVARAARILPLPVRRRAADGTVEIHEYKPLDERERTVVIERGAASQSATGSSSVPPRVQQWKNSLLDLTLRNRLINYSDRAGVGLVVPEGRLGTMEDLISAGRGLSLRPHDAVDAVQAARGASTAAQLTREALDAQLLDKSVLFANVTSAAYQTRMRGLAYKARTIVEETGANNLYLALGSLSWSIQNKPLRSPLVLVPVQLRPTARGGLYKLELDETGASTPNYCLLEKLREVHGLEIPLLANPEADDSGIDLDGALAAVRDAIARASLPFRVEPTADLSILQFAKFRLWKDLDEHWESLTKNSLVNHLVHTPNLPFADPAPVPTDVDLDALDAECPVAADASQLAAVADAISGRTFVLEGPPGTGKSQTITNLLTRAVADGQRVLFVAEKRAALDVVMSRLNSVGMGDFSLDLHDRGSKPAAVRSQIRAAMDYVAAFDEQGLAANTADLEQSRRVLARYAGRLHEQNGRGLSYYTARTKLLTLGTEGPAFEIPEVLLSSQAEAQVRELSLAAASLDDVAQPARPSPDHPWGFARAKGVDGQRARLIRDAAARFDSALNALPELGTLAGVVDAATDQGHLSQAAVLAQAAPVDLAVMDQARSAGWRESARRAVSEMHALVARSHPALEVVTPAALDLPVREIHSRAQDAAASGFFGRKKRLKAVLAELHHTLRPGVEVRPKELLQLTAHLVDVHRAASDTAQQLSDVPGINLPAPWNPFTDECRDLVAQQVEQLISTSERVPASDQTDQFSARLRDWLRSSLDPAPYEVKSLVELASSWEVLASSTGATPESLSSWRAGQGLTARWRSTSRGRGLEEETPLSLTRWLAFDAALAAFEDAGMSEAADLLRSGQVDAAEAGRALERGIARASIKERERASGLDTFDHVGHDRAVDRFVSSSQAVRADLRLAAPASVIESRTFDASSSIGQVGELQRELAKQRRALGVRGLMERYGDLITRLMPCVLVSPDSVARFFSVGSLQFDVVVFDEASQIRVADAVGAMGRARSVVVVGDSKQMPPTSFGESSLLGDDDITGDDSAVVEDSESILTEAVAARVPQRWLTWHYRSQDESLIAFSNVKYYDGKLSSFPAPTSATEDRLAAGRGISLVRVDGRFRRGEKGKLLRTNPEEAMAIVADLERRFAASPETPPSVGVVTFNLQQRAYIEALLRDSGHERMIQALEERDGEGLFVKNLENVQGDERDVILFSTAFSANEKGVVPLNFGPLTRAGGERRLNVAVTRARRQVVLYSSFDPGQLRVTETQSVGIKHLHAYLELAAQGPDQWAAATPAVRSLPDRHRDEIAEALRLKGLAVGTDVGMSDFRIDLTLASPQEPSKPLVAVLLDGPGWAQRRTVGDRDGLPPQVLHNMMRWPAVERVWMPAWVDHPQDVLDRLMEAVREAKDTEARSPSPHQATSPATTPVPVPSSATAETSPLSTSTTRDKTMEEAIGSGIRSAPAPTRTQTQRQLEGQEEFVAFVPRSRGSRTILDDLPAPYARDAVRRVIEEVVEMEGPVHKDRLARHVAACFALTRVNSARSSAILAALPRGFTVTRNDPFVWPEALDPDEWGSFRRSAGDDRPLDHVALREIGNAMVALCRNAAGVSADELDSAALALFGGKRRTAGIAARLAAARELTVREGRMIVTAGEMYRVAD